MDAADYCVVSLNGFELHIQKAGPDTGEMSFYMSVDNLDTVWDLVKIKNDQLELREPFEQAYGMREIHVHVPHTKALMFIGQPVDQQN